MKTYTIILKTPDFLDYEDLITGEPLLVYYFTDTSSLKAARKAQEAAARMFAATEEDDFDIDDFKVVLILSGDMKGSIAVQVTDED